MTLYPHTLLIEYSFYTRKNWPSSWGWTFIHGSFKRDLLYCTFCRQRAVKIKKSKHVDVIYGGPLRQTRPLSTPRSVSGAAADWSVSGGDLDQMFGQINQKSSWQPNNRWWIKSAVSLVTLMIGERQSAVLLCLTPQSSFLAMFSRVELKLPTGLTD